MVTRLGPPLEGSAEFDASHILPKAEVTADREERYLAYLL
jgi:hypothetical protein